MLPFTTFLLRVHARELRTFDNILRLVVFERVQCPKLLIISGERRPAGRPAPY